MNRKQQDVSEDLPPGLAADLFETKKAWTLSLYAKNVMIPIPVIAPVGATMTTKDSSKSIAKSAEPNPSWTFLTNHAHVLICLAREPDCVLRRVASLVGITERAVQRIVSDLEEAGYIERRKDGRRNVYSLLLSKSLRHEVEANCKIGELIAIIK